MISIEVYILYSPFFRWHTKLCSHSSSMPYKEGKNKLKTNNIKRAKSYSQEVKVEVFFLLADF